MPFVPQSSFCLLCFYMQSATRYVASVFFHLATTLAFTVSHSLPYLTVSQCLFLITLPQVLLNKVCALVLYSQHHNLWTTPAVSQSGVSLADCLWQEKWRRTPCRTCVRGLSVSKGKREPGATLSTPEDLVTETCSITSALRWQTEMGILQL